MYIYTKRGMVAVAAYDPERKNRATWLIDEQREMLHDEAAAGSPILLVRGWHNQVIADLVGSGTCVYYDPDADYPYRALVRPGDLARAVAREVFNIDYRSLKVAVGNSHDTLYCGTLWNVHEETKERHDDRIEEDEELPDFLEYVDSVGWMDDFDQETRDRILRRQGFTINRGQD